MCPVTMREVYGTLWAEWEDEQKATRRKRRPRRLTPCCTLLLAPSPLSLSVATEHACLLALHRGPFLHCLCTTCAATAPPINAPSPKFSEPLNRRCMQQFGRTVEHLPLPNTVLFRMFCVGICNVMDKIDCFGEVMFAS